METDRPAAIEKLTVALALYDQSESMTELVDLAELPGKPQGPGSRRPAGHEPTPTPVMRPTPRPTREPRRARINRAKTAWAILWLRTTTRLKPIKTATSQPTTARPRAACSNHAGVYDSQPEPVADDSRARRFHRIRLHGPWWIVADSQPPQAVPAAAPRVTLPSDNAQQLDEAMALTVSVPP
ncbi:MAG: hypothetical protein R3B96_11965 [Pirellulaceae bacterium]